MRWFTRSRSGVARPRPSRFRPHVEALEDRAVPASLLVNSLLDNTIAGDGLVTLREAIAAANSDTATDLGQAGSGADSISFDPSLFAGGTQTLDMDEFLGQFYISGDLTITGPGASLLTIDAQQKSRIFAIFGTSTSNPANGAVTLDGMTLTGGRTTGTGTAGSGGAIFSNASNGLTVRNCTITGNSAAGTNTSGGGIFGSNSDLLVENSIIANNTATGTGGGLSSTGVGRALTISDCTISNNTASGGLARGGGLSLGSGTQLSMTGSRIIANTAVGIGGGIFAPGTNRLSIVDCEISGNSTTGAGNGGGGVVMFGGFAPVLFQNTTISGNFTAGANAPGGGLLIANQNLTSTDPVVLQNCTIAGNSASGTGGGIAIQRHTLTLQSTLVAANTAGAGLAPDVDANLGSTTAPSVMASNSLIGDNTGSGLAASGSTPDADGNYVGSSASPIDPLLGPLGDYGGPTQTMPLLPGSLALDSGSGTGADQRGVDPVGTRDIGAFESKGFTLAIFSGSGQATPTNTAFAAPLVVLVTANDPAEPVAGGVVTFTAPGSGASAALSSLTAVIGAGGTASVTATANGTAGAYDVTASARGAAAAPATFALTNLSTQTASQLASQLIDEIKALISSGAVGNGTGTSLINAYLKKVTDTTGIALIDAFLAKVEKDIQQGKITQAVGGELIAAGLEIRALLTA